MPALTSGEHFAEPERGRHQGAHTIIRTAKEAFISVPHQFSLLFNSSSHGHLEGRLVAAALPHRLRFPGRPHWLTPLSPLSTITHLLISLLQRPGWVC